jgi:hypothetical protein
LDEDEAVGTLADEGDLSMPTKGIGITIRETVPRIAPTGRAVDHLCDETVIFAMNEISTGEIVTIAGFRESTTRTSGLLALQNPGRELWTRIAALDRLIRDTSQEHPPDPPRILPIMHLLRTD